MKYKKKTGYTLAEIMVVMLILTVIFAAFAPLITKRRNTINRSKYAVWNYVDYTSTMNAYYIPEDSKQTGTAFFGITPDGQGDIESSLLPYARVIIRSGPVTSSNKLQRQMQFRYGHNTTYGEFAGTWLMANRNMLLGGEYSNLNNIPNNIEAQDNVGIGYESLTSITNARGNTALGSYALTKTTSGKNNTAIGYKAGAAITTAANNTFIGSGAGAGMSGSGNTAIGYYAANANSSGNNNLFIGAQAGEFFKGGDKNTAIGYKALNSLNSGSSNIAIGVSALQNLKSGSYNVALGYGACRNLEYSSYKTCIGYNSGPTEDTTGENYLDAIGSTSHTDNEQRTYIGSRPHNYGGDAVMEIHNVGGSGPLVNSPSVAANVTTVINGNLIVMGRPYFTLGSTLWNMHSVKISKTWHSDKKDNMGASNNNDICANDQRTYTFRSGCVGLTSSDRRLKNIGTKFSAGLDELNKIKVYKYTFKNDENKRPQVGVVAQELQKVFPNAVTTGKDGYLRIRWDEMFYASINAIKELDRRITSLIDRATNVEVQIAQLENENSDLHSKIDELSLRIEKLKTK